MQFLYISDVTDCNEEQKTGAFRWPNGITQNLNWRLHFFTVLRPYFDKWWPSAASPSWDECGTNWRCLQIRQRWNDALLRGSFAQVTNIWPLTAFCDIGSINRIEEWFRSSPYSPLPRDGRPDACKWTRSLTTQSHPPTIRLIICMRPVSQAA